MRGRGFGRRRGSRGGSQRLRFGVRGSLRLRRGGRARREGGHAKCKAGPGHTGGREPGEEARPELVPGELGHPQ